MSGHPAKNHVRPAVVADIPAILDLLVQVNMVHHEGRPDLFKGPATKYNEEELKAILQDKNTPVFVCEDEDKRILGHAFCIFQFTKETDLLYERKTLYIDDICVDEAARRRNAATDLYHHVLSFAKEHDCYNVTLNVWDCNPGAFAFYRAMGMSVQKTCMEQILN